MIASGGSGNMTPAFAWPEPRGGEGRKGTLVLGVVLVAASVSASIGLGLVIARLVISAMLALVPTMGSAPGRGPDAV